MLLAYQPDLHIVGTPIGILWTIIWAGFIGYWMYRIAIEFKPQTEPLVENEDWDEDWDEDWEDEPVDNRPMTQDDWNVIARIAIEDAKKGNASARAWVSKHCTTPTPSVSTSPDLIKDAIACLVNLGHKKKDAEVLVHKAVAAKHYDNISELIADANV